MSVKQFLLPPLNVFVLAAFLLLFHKVVRIPRRAAAAIIVAAAYLICTPLVGDNLLALHQTHPPLSAPLQAGPEGAEAIGGAIGEAIVVLGAGYRDTAPEAGGTLLDALSLERVLYAGFLQARTGLPILTTGGRVRPSGEGAHRPVARTMAAFLRGRLDAEVRWVEPDARSTWENARLSADKLRGAGIGRVYLVTHAWHMPRAARAFAAHDLKVIPAPTAFVAPPGLTLSALLPSHRGLSASYYGLHELFGRLAYRLYPLWR